MSSVNMNSLMAARNAILNQNNALQDLTKNNGLGRAGQVPGPKVATGAESFSAQLSSALQDVNHVAAVMLAKHKASLGFESTLQVRNKLLSAYKDIMNMQV